MIRSVSVLLILIGLLSVTFVADAKAAAISIVVNSDSVTLNMNLQLHENLTTISGSVVSLPQTNIFLDQTNSTAVRGPVEAAIQGIIGGARVSLLKAWISTRQTDPSTKSWVFQENYTMIVQGANTNLGGLVNSNLAFLSMKIDNSLNVGGLQINNIGLAYLLPNLQNVKPVGTTYYYIDGGLNLLPRVPEEVTSGFNMLDLSWVPPISQWSSTFQPLPDSTTWDTTPKSPYNLTIALGRTPEGTFQQVIVAVLNPSLELTVPARAYAQGTNVLFNIPTSAELLMSAIIGVLIVLAIVTFYVDRKLSRRVRLRGKRR